QRMLLVTCEAPARASCACPSGKGMQAFATMKATALRCCDVLVVPAALPQVAQERAAKAIPAPILVLVPGQLAITQPVSERAPRVAHLDPPPASDRVLANHALLI
ncbi:MAG: hypothetical protein ACJ79G_03520, partial [Myxococcales bacterium]